VNDGAEKTPDRAVRPIWVVRLASFGAASLLAALVLFGIASLRYAAWLAEDVEGAAVLSEVVRAPAPDRQPQPPPSPPVRETPTDPQQRDTIDAAPAVAPSAPSEPQVITNPVWISRPRNPERFYPRDAFMQGVSGEVVLDCAVQITGRLECVVASETPADRGFGAAALQIAAQHVMQPATQNGAPVRGRYRMTVPFSTGG
jgi:TonB family protein